MTAPQPPRTYSEAIDFLYGSLPMFQRQGGTAVKKGLDNIHALAETLGHPERTYPVVHIAGTNGKGSTAHILAAILQQHGLRVGLYTSPHYVDFRERIKINGKWIPQEGVVDFLRTIWPDIQHIRPSFFELTVAMAFDHFRNEKVDAAIIETGLGGRLDSTNIVHPLLSIITNIGRDHQEFLGHTLEAIAAEKAGIIKEKTPVLIGRSQPETISVFERHARAAHAPLYDAKEIVDCTHRGLASLSQAHYGIRWAQGAEHIVLSDLTPPYQAANIRTALAAAALLRNAFGLDRHTALTALENVRTATGLMGRWQLIHTRPPVIIDSAHNADGIRAALNTLPLYSYDQLHIIYAAAADKDIAAIVPLLPHKAVRYYLTEFDLPRKMPVHRLMQTFQQEGLPAAPFPTSAQALKAACTHAGENDLILVIGSVFLAGEILQNWKAHNAGSVTLR